MQRKVEQLLAQLQASEHDKFAAEDRSCAAWIEEVALHGLTL
jgi:hypothetical protein